MLLGLILILASPFLIASRGLGVVSDLSFWCSLPVLVGLALYAGGRRRARWALALASGASVFGLLCLYAYKSITLANIHSQLLLQSFRDAGVTVATSFPAAFVWPRIAGGLAAAGAQAALVLCAERWMRAHFARRPATRRDRLLINGLVALIALVYARAGWASFEQYRDSALLTALREQSVVDARVAGPADDVLILQLESVNAKALYDWDESRRGVREVVEAKGLKRLWRERHGVLFPFFWANTSITNRAFETILCGISGNMNVKSREDGGGDFTKDCLANVLKRAGFSTTYYYSFFDDVFYGYGRLMPRYGFENFIFGPALMRAGDRRFPWGYDDCQFYRRVAEHVGARPRDARPRFTYASVSMHHEPFDAKAYPEAWATPDAPDKSTRYLNSLLEQDHCVAEFGRVIDALGDRPLHVFILGDHSIPLRDDLEPEDRFFTSLLYLPPRGASSAPRMITTSQPPSQSDLLPTILDLLYQTSSARSFAGVLKGDVAYDPADRCATSVNGNGIIQFARENARALYEFEPAGVAYAWTRGDASAPWLPRSRASSFADFYAAERCRR